MGQLHILEVCGSEIQRESKGILDVYYLKLEKLGKIEGWLSVLVKVLAFFLKVLVHVDFWFFFFFWYCESN